VAAVAPGVQREVTRDTTSLLDSDWGRCIGAGSLRPGGTNYARPYPPGSYSNRDCRGGAAYHDFTNSHSYHNTEGRSDFNDGVRYGA